MFDNRHATEGEVIFLHSLWLYDIADNEALERRPKYEASWTLKKGAPQLENETPQLENETVLKLEKELPK